MQLGGLSHGLSHYVAEDADAPHAACELCSAYSVFDRALASVPPIPPAPASRTVVAGERQVLATAASFLPYRSRAPPSFV